MILKKHLWITTEQAVVRSTHRDCVDVHLTERDLKFLWSLSANYLLHCVNVFKAELREKVTEGVIWQ